MCTCVTLELTAVENMHFNLQQKQKFSVYIYQQSAGKLQYIESEEEQEGTNSGGKMKVL